MLSVNTDMRTAAKAHVKTFIHVGHIKYVFFWFVLLLYGASDPYVSDIKQVNTIYMNIYIYMNYLLSL